MLSPTFRRVDCSLVNGINHLSRSFSGPPCHVRPTVLSRKARHGPVFKIHGSFSIAANSSRWRSPQQNAFPSRSTLPSVFGPVAVSPLRFRTSSTNHGNSVSPRIQVEQVEAHWSGTGLALWVAVVFAATVVVAAWSKGNELDLHAEAQPDHSASKKDKQGSSSAPKHKIYGLDEIRQHGADSERPWVVKGNGVYDITDWVGAHPGGKVILRAAGSAVEPYWDIFTIHKKEDVYEILEQYRIGDVDPRDLSPDGTLPHGSIEDPFREDPQRDARLLVHTSRPCNAETPASELSDFLTDNTIFYVRNHLWVPHDDAKSHRLTIDLGDGSDEKTYSIHDLRTKFPQHTITAVMQCSGNRRSHMAENCSQPVSGLSWDVGAIGNAEWRGPRLRDVLRDAGLNVDHLPEDLHHAQFTGTDAYGASIPIETAVDARGDVLLACEMNGKPLPRDHGYPVRVLVPGITGARSVKWVDRITLSDEESTSQWQKRDYKCFGPNQLRDTVDWDSAPAIQETPIQSAITAIRRVQGADNTLAIEGYAFSGAGRRVIRVDVSVDDGKTWDQADLVPDRALGSKAWSWTRWRYRCPRPKSGSVVVVKAVDDSYNVQPDSYAPTYNFRGNLTNAWHRIKIGGGDVKDQSSQKR